MPNYSSNNSGTIYFDNTITQPLTYNFGTVTVSSNICITQGGVIGTVEQSPHVHSVDGVSSNRFFHNQTFIMETPEEKKKREEEKYYIGL